MKPAPPGSTAKYTPFDAGQDRPESGEMCPREAPAAAKVGERHESSVLFSLATLSATARKAPAAPAAPTESSTLIDIRALCDAAAKADAPASRAVDIVNLGGGGAFAPVLAPPLAPLGSPEEPARTRNRRAPIVALALAGAFIATTTVVALAVTRPARASAPVTTATTLASTTPTTPVATTTPTATTPTTTVATATTTIATPSIPVPATATSSTARAQTRKASAPPAPTTAPAPTATTTTTKAAKCCPGEPEMACHMRIAVGAPCG